MRATWQSTTMIFLLTLLAFGCDSSSSRRKGIPFAASGRSTTAPGGSSGAVLALSTGPAQAANGTAAAGATGVPVLQIHLAGDPTEAIIVDTLALTAFGSGNDATGVTGVRVYVDANADGQVQTGETQLGTAQTYPADDGQVSFLALAQTIAAGGAADWLVVYDFSTAAVPGTTFSVRVQDAASIGATASVSPAVQITGTPLTGAQITIAAALPATTVVIQPGPIDGKDAWVKSYGLYQNDNYGATGHLGVGDRDSQPGDQRIFIEFPLADVPNGKTVVKAELHLYYYGTEYHNEVLTLQAFKVIETKNKNGRGGNQTPWVEGNNGYDTNLDGICWDGNLSGGTYPYNDSQRPEFTQPDVDQTTDYGSGPNGLLSEVKVDQQTGKWVVLDVTGAVQAWRAGTSANYGLMLRHKEEGSPFLDGVKDFYSSDYLQDSTLRPKLAVTVQ